MRIVPCRYEFLFYPNLGIEERVMNPRIFVPESQLESFCEANGIARLDLFGSALRADFGPESDIDLLVQFKPDRTPGLLDFVRIEQEFSEIFGRKVDLIERLGVERSRNYIRRAAILESAETIYAA